MSERMTPEELTRELRRVNGQIRDLQAKGEQVDPENGRWLLCPCSYQLGMVDTRTNEVRAGYGTQAVAYFPATFNFVLFCKRCKQLVGFGPGGHRVGFVSPSFSIRPE